MAYLQISDIIYNVIKNMKRYLKYKGVTVNAFGVPVFNSGKSNTVRKGELGRRYFQYKCFNHNYRNNSPKNLIVMYDISSDKKKEREWLLRQLKGFDYVMVQKSVWVGPSPLPRDFLNYVKKIGLSEQLRTLKLAKPYSREEKNM